MQAQTTIDRRSALLQFAGFLAAFPVNLARKDAARGRPRLVIVLLKGGADGLALVPPLGDPDYVKARTSLALYPRDWMGHRLDLGGGLALHPSLQPLEDLYRRGELLVAVGTGVGGAPLSHASSLEQLLGNMPAKVPTDSGVAAAQLSGSARDQLLDAVAELDRGEVVCAELLRHLGCAADSVLASRLRVWGSDFKHSAANLGSTLQMGRGPEVSILQLKGWDTHTDQGSATGRLSLSGKVLSDALRLLAEACGSSWRRTVVVITTEFGRTVSPNARGGTDHGSASATLVVGGAVAGGRIVGQWPSMTPASLGADGGLPATMDVRSILKSALIDHLELPRSYVDTGIYPDSSDISPLPQLLRG